MLENRAPSPGDGNRAILSDLGYTPGDVEHFAADCVIHEQPPGGA